MLASAVSLLRRARRWTWRHRRGVVLFVLLLIALAVGGLVARSMSPSRRARILAERGRILVGNGQLEAGLGLFEQAYELEPDEPRHAVERTDLLGRLGRWEEAERIAREAQRRAPQDAATISVLGWVLLSRGRPAETVHVLRPATELLGSHPDPAFACHALTTLGRALASTGDLTAAERQLRKACALRSVYGAPPAQAQREQAWLVLAEVLRLQRRYSEAEALLRDGLAAAPDSPILGWELGRHLAGLDRLEEAVTVLRRAATSAGEGLRLEVAWLESDVLIRLGQPDRAAAVAKRLPQGEGVIIELAVQGSLALLEGDPVRARGHFARLGQLLPRSARPLLLEARAATRSNAIADARGLLAQALEREPGNREAERILLELEERAGDAAAVRARAERLLEDPVLRALALRALFSLSTGQGETRGALERLAALKQRHPDDLSVRAYEAVFRVLAGEIEQGVNDLVALSGKEGLPAAFSLLASMREGAADALEAIEMLAALAERQEGFAPARLVLAGIYARLARYDLAVREVDATLAREPDRRDARRLRAALAVATDDLTRAVSELDALRAAQAPPAELLPLIDATSERIFASGRDPRPDELALAVRLLELAVALFPERAVAHARLARARFLLGNTDAALQGFARALTLEPTLPAAHGAATISILRGEHAKAAQELRQALARTGDPRFGAPLAAALALTGDFTGARAALLPWLDVAGRCPEGRLVLVILGSLGGGQEPPPAAIEGVPPEVLAGGIALAGPGAETRRRESLEMFAVWSLGLMVEARARSARVVRDHPDDPLLLWWAQRPFAAGGTAQLRLHVSERLAAVAPASRWPGLELADARRELGDVAGEAAVLEGLARKFGDDPQVRAQLGRLHERSGRTAAAIAEYRLAVGAPDPPLMAVNNLACLLAPDPAQREEALALARKARDRAPERGATWDTLGWALFLAGRPEEAEPILGWAAAQEPASPSIRYHLARCLAAQGKRVRALNHLRIARLLSRPFPEASEARTLEEELAR